MCFPTVYAVQVMTIGEMNYGRMLLDWSFNSSRQSRSGWNHVLLHWFVLFCYCMLLNLMQTCEWKNFKFALFLVTWHLWWFYTCSSYIFMYIYLSIGVITVRVQSNWCKLCLFHSLWFPTLIWYFRSFKSEHGEHLLQTKELPKGHQVLQNGSGSGPQFPQRNEVTTNNIELDL